ncbi:Putative zn(2)-C6 fungal-type DNA-binding domain-containing protein [Septoria linicola]|uniref:Zn(2)-C6 fungal-type DNA-binding domain-containing protein n=1 Tax=Septoria linicola TaxID=215465 RepID=A0A9Q9AYW3_9PEZI|nr:putative zn(2)-C6 fungal-type DNA-binding domain-containing protein [Septoria linicola]USW53186.1 Putative zn(2)-C6 fungal-type DNA-binding domain-containing protein [Septoria linicola]
MALPTDHVFEATPAYVVYRDLQPGEPFDPTSPLLFFPPKGSDELFDALRIAFPHLKTHSERMRDAIIQFLLDERQEEQLQASPAMTMDTTAQTWPSMSSSGSASVFSSPDLLDLPTPTSFANSPQAQAPQLARQASTATSGQASPPSLDQMTGVFSLSAEAQPKQRVRRKMTEAEKVEYRKRRIVKACDKCAKRKRKCPHNQAQMEVVPRSKSGAKSVKPVSHRTGKADKQIANSQDSASVQPLMADNLDFAAGLDMGSFQTFDDFPMFEDSFPEFTVDDLMYFDQPGVNFQPQDYFTPNLSPPQQSRSSGSINHSLDEALPQIPAQHVPGGTGHAPILGVDENHELQSRTSSTESGTQQQSRRSGMRVSTEAETRTNTLLGISHGGSGSLQEGERQDGNHNRNGNGMLWEHLRTGQQEAPQSTHTAHVHNAGCGEIFGPSEANGALREPRLKPTRSQTTLQLVGKTNAVLPSAEPAKVSASSPSSQQLVSRSGVDNALRRTTEQELDVPDGRVQTHQSAEHTRPHSSTPGLSNSALRESSSRSATAVQPQGESVRTSSSTGKPELRLQTSTSVSHSGGLRIGTAALPQGRPQPQLSSIGKNPNPQQILLTSDPTSRNASAQQQKAAPTAQEDGIANHKRTTSNSTQAYRLPTRTLGQGVAPLSSISTELYMMRRRIPRKPGTNQNHQHTTNAVNYQDVQLSAQANGGAYQRLQPRDAHAAANGSGRTPAIALTPVSIVGTHAIKDARAIDASMAAQSAFTYHGDVHGRADKTPQQDRLLDHVRFRDHHGRPSATSASILAAVLVFGVMLFAGTLPGIATCYAAWYSLFSPEKEESVQCTEKNSAWLVDVLSKRMDFSTQKKGGEEFAGASTANEAWSKGLMYPFAYSPLRFVTMV